MRSSVVEIGNVFYDLVKQVPFAQDEQEIQALAAQTAHEPLANCISAGRLDRRMQHLNPRSNGGSVELRSIFGIVVADENPRTCTEGCRFAQLLGHPDLSRMA